MSSNSIKTDIDKLDVLNLQQLQTDKYENSEDIALLGILLSIKTAKKNIDGINIHTKLKGVMNKGYSKQRYNRILTFLDPLSENGQCFVLIFENAKKFENFITNFKGLTIGKCITIDEPNLIYKYFDKKFDLPIITNNLAFKENNYPTSMRNINLVTPKTGCTRGFIYKNQKITVKRSVLLNITCNGLLCDKQKVDICG